MLGLVNQLLDVVKLDAGIMETEMTRFSTQEMVDAVLNVLDIQLTAKKLDIQICIAPEAAELHGDKQKCRQILVNLVANAAKYTPSAGSIAIRVEMTGPDLASISVADTGIGIEPEEQQKIFAEFHQTQTAREGHFGGTGIGLSLARRLVELHGGQIFVKSATGKGSTFWFTLPQTEAKRDEEPQREDAQREDAPARLAGQFAGRRILVVEDNEVDLIMILDMLHVFGFETTVARNGREAMEAAKTCDPELVLMDLRMPVMDGFETTKSLRAVPAFKDLPIVALSASVDKAALERAMEAGCDAHLPKPVQSMELAEMLQRFLKPEGQSP